MHCAILNCAILKPQQRGNKTDHKWDAQPLLLYSPYYRVKCSLKEIALFLFNKSTIEMISSCRSSFSQERQSSKKIFSLGRFKIVNTRKDYYLGAHPSPIIYPHEQNNDPGFLGQIILNMMRMMKMLDLLPCIICPGKKNNSPGTFHQKVCDDQLEFVFICS